MTAHVQQMLQFILLQQLFYFVALDTTSLIQSIIAQYYSWSCFRLKSVAILQLLNWNINIGIKMAPGRDRKFFPTRGIQWT